VRPRRTVRALRVRQFSAAQSVRARLSPIAKPTAASYGAALGPRLLEQATRLAEVATSGQLVLFLGSGTSQTNDMPCAATPPPPPPPPPPYQRPLSRLWRLGAAALQHCRTVALPHCNDVGTTLTLVLRWHGDACLCLSLSGWSELLSELGEFAGLSPSELDVFRSLELKDQAIVLQHRLGTRAIATTGDGDDDDDDGDDWARPRVTPSPEAVQEAGRAALQRLVVSRLTTRRYSVTHTLRDRRMGPAGPTAPHSTPRHPTTPYGTPRHPTAPHGTPRHPTRAKTHTPSRHAYHAGDARSACHHSALGDRHNQFGPVLRRSVRCCGH
jgi:hypothetical protein